MDKLLHVIHIGWEGLMTEHTPRLFSNADLAGEFFESKVTEKGFRERGKNESWPQYVEAFGDWEDSDQCTYDKMDWEIHWWENVAVDAEEEEGS